MKRYVFMVSDGTGLTAESLGNSLLSQFEGLELDKHAMPYIDTIEKAREIVTRHWKTSLRSNHPIAWVVHMASPIFKVIPIGLTP